MNQRLLTYLVIMISFFMISCEKDTKPEGQKKTASIESLFELKSVKDCGIDFNNTIVENDIYNYFTVDVIINGGGVAVVDINNDGLLDVFFAGNQVSDRLYLNKGNLQFEDITKSAGIENETWSTAIAIADINQDGLPDIYVGKFLLNEPEKRQNVLYLNNGDLTFTESAAKYGLNHNGHCTAANFFDYDMDGDLDLYLGIEPFVLRHFKFSKSDNYKEADYTDRLFRNDGGTFTDVTVAAGLQNFNYTLSATVGDVNQDGWPDLYVASDFEEPDYYYINNRNGTFTNHIHTAMRHISNFSMGSDMADFNNDGWVDIVTADMAPEDNYRSKANMSGMNPKKFWSLAQNGYHHQYMFNTLQLNNGNGTYSEIGHLANIAQTDWSWATLFGDYNLDGHKDIFITNGQLRDVRNKDFLKKVDHVLDSLKAKGIEQSVALRGFPLTNYAPQEPLANYLFLNDGHLAFSNKASENGMKAKTFSQGAAYADLDNDGDLDLLLNNMNERAFLYENHATEQANNHYLSVKLVGSNPANVNAYGAKVWLFTENGKQLLEVNPVRGYMSSSDPALSFGLGTVDKIDRLVVQWPGNLVTELNEVKIDQRLVLHQKDAISKQANIFNFKAPIFTDYTTQSKIDYNHKENKFDDYKDEVLIPHRMSRLGPGAAKADVNGDGLEDVFLGAAAGTSGTLFLQQANNTLLAAPSQPWQTDAASEDIHAHFFDADKDGDADLYITSGGNEFALNSPKLQDRLYINKGNGVFTKSNNLPNIRSSGGVCTAGDLDGDGDLDLFIGGRQVPGKYGFPAQSFILRNDNGHFVDISEEMGINLKEMGMVTDAAWTDLDGDKDQDLVILGEWMPITIFINEGGKLVNKTKESGFENSNGWWSRLALADMDNDGDIDIVAGNLGLNIKFKASKEKPFAAYIKDFDENGSNDTYLAYYDASGKVFPVRGKQCSTEQMAFVSEEFVTYHDFALATVEQVLGDRMEGAIKHKAYEFKTLYFENKGNGQFAAYELPAITQSFPVFGIIPRDWNNDGHLDLLLAGNYYEREIETTRSDAGIGLVLLGNGKGDFEALPPYETGIFAYLDVKNLVVLENKQKPLVLIVNNNTGVQVYR